MQLRAIAAMRMANQQIESSTRASVSDVVTQLTAVQAQDYRGALWSIGLRYRGSTIDDVERAIAAREIVRTWPMRRTLHFVAAADVRWMLQLLAPRMIKGAVGRMRQLELDDKLIARSAKALAKALRDGKRLTREELYAVLERAKISAANQRGIHILSRLSQESFLCFASHRGKQPAFALLDEWIPTSRMLARDEALAELTLRYFRGHGPATVRDLAWWAGITLGDARAGVAMVASELQEERIGDTAYVVTKDAVAGPGSTRSVHLLPGFDEYLLGYTDRSVALDAIHAGAIVPGNNGMFMPTIVAGGRVVGTWKPVLNAKGNSVTAFPFAPLNARDERALAVTAKRYARFTLREH
jgi:hypothetical protein